MPDSFFINPSSMYTLLVMHVRHAIKTGLASAMAYGISCLFGSEFGLWALISTLIVMQGISVADSLQDSLFRFTGMSLGALVGMVFLIITPDNPLVLTLVAFLLCGAGAYLGRYGNRFTLATTAACIVVIAGQRFAGDSLTSQALFGFALAWEVLLGVGCAVAVSLLLWPIRLGDTLRSDMATQFEKCAALLDTVVDSYLDDQHHVPYSQFEGLRLQTWSNRERMVKVRKLEAHIYHYEHKALSIQVDTIERCVEAMRSLIAALNEYDDAAYNPIMGPELRPVADASVRALRHLGGPDAYSHSPGIVRDLTRSVDNAESRLTVLRKERGFRSLSLHRVLQLYTFYQVLRQLAEELLFALYEMQVLGEQPMLKKKVTQKRYASGKSCWINPSACKPGEWKTDKKNYDSNV